MTACPACGKPLECPCGKIVRHEIDVDCSHCGQKVVFVPHTRIQQLERAWIFIGTPFAFVGMPVGTAIAWIARGSTDVIARGIGIGSAMFALLGLVIGTIYVLRPSREHDQPCQINPNFENEAEYKTILYGSAFSILAGAFVAVIVFVFAGPNETLRHPALVIPLGALLGLLVTPVTITFILDAEFHGRSDDVIPSRPSGRELPPLSAQTGDTLSDQSRERLTSAEESQRLAGYERGTTEYDRAMARVYQLHCKRKERRQAHPLRPVLIALAMLTMTPLLLEFLGVTQRDPIGLLTGAAVATAILRIFDMLRFWVQTLRVWGIGALRQVPVMTGVMFRTRSFYPYWWYRGWWLVLLLTCFNAQVFLLPEPRHLPVLITVCWLVIVACMYLRPTVPPTVLILTASSEDRINWVTGIAYRLFPLRVVSLLEPELLNPRSTSSPEASLVRYHSAKWHFLMRTRGPRWLDQVITLVNLAPIVVVDTRSPIPPAVVEEIREMLFESRRSKAVFVGTSDGRYPGLERLSPSPSTDGVFVVEDDVEPLLWSMSWRRDQIPSSPGYLFIARPLAAVTSPSV